MPLGDIAAGLISGAARLVAHIFLEIVIEILVRGPGYLICRVFRRDIDPDGGWVVVVGLSFWFALLFLAIVFFA
ncbi:MAG: hypothetical protein KJ795_01790 [Gammaproteobacteria bacterium]|nr:hypothetical protein [Gammaproteobacteria bacterium]MBU1775040.1 hypothetical protein [Gammaproteobacteria bacterium]